MNWGAVGLSVSCPGDLQEGQTRNNQLPIACGETRQRLCHQEPWGNPGGQTRKEHQSQRAHGNARASRCSRSHLAPHSGMTPCEVTFPSLSSTQWTWGPMCSVLKENSQSLYVCTSYQNSLGEGYSVSYLIRYLLCNRTWPGLKFPKWEHAYIIMCCIWLSGSCPAEGPAEQDSVLYCTRKGNKAAGSWTSSHEN